MNVWLDGRIVPVQEARVSVLDHGLTVGDGVFETIKVVDGTPFALTRHLQRLASSARGLGLTDPDEKVVRRAVEEVLDAAGQAERASSRLRITVTGGPSPLGSSRGDGDPTLVVALAPLTGWEPTTSLVTVPWTRNERSAVAGLKTTSYAENVVALAYAHERGASEALFLNTRGEVCEGTGSNVFAVVGGTVVTPPLDSGCLAGVTRALVLEWCGGEERVVAPQDLATADEVFLASTTRDIQPVHRVDDRDLPAPGPVTAAAQRTFAGRAREQVDP